uniref:Uncharacterized protein n=1 Tax=Rhodopseudomonas palustris (strain BisA53) TaxID=316055 RepID=Q07NR8_RHOP5
MTRSPSAKAEQISREGRKVTAGRHSDARERISNAMRRIEDTLIANDGVYPNSKDGKVGIRNVLMEAELSITYFEKKDRPKIVALKMKVQAWLAKLGRVSAGNVKAIRRKVTARADAAQAEANEVRQRYAEAELEYAATLLELSDARKSVDGLKQRNAELLAQIANVIPIDRKRK